MNKLLIAAAAAFLAFASLLTTGAEAGFSARLAAPKGFSNVHKAGCHGGGYRRRVYRKRRQSVRRVRRNKVHIARKHVSKPAEVAKVEVEKEEPVETAAIETENSSIVTADGNLTEAKDKETEQKVAVAKELGCKKFLPAVGMTLSVPCE